MRLVKRCDIAYTSHRAARSVSIVQRREGFRSVMNEQITTTTAQYETPHIEQTETLQALLTGKCDKVGPLQWDCSGGTGYSG